MFQQASGECTCSWVLWYFNISSNLCREFWWWQNHSIQMGRSERSSKWQEQNDELRSRLSCTSAQVSCSWNLHIQVGLLVDLCNYSPVFVLFCFSFYHCLLSMSHPILSSVHPFEISSAYNRSCHPREWVMTLEIWQHSQLLLKPLVALWHLRVTNI